MNLDSTSTHAAKDSAGNVLTAAALTRKPMRNAISVLIMSQKGQGEEPWSEKNQTDAETVSGSMEKKETGRSSVTRSRGK